MENNEQSPAKKKVESYDIAKSDETLNLAQDLTRFIKENKLTMNLQGKEYVLCEGWQYAGSRLGILPIVEELTNESTDTEIRYRSRVRLLNLRNDQTVGSGFATCSNKEAGKKYFQEFAIASMAQTRAIGKAYRNLLAWIIRAAGYEPCPAEEYEAVVIQQDERRKAKTKADLAVSAADPSKVNETGDNATTRQKADILLLLNDETISKEEKEKVILQINKYTREKADKCIAWLKKEIAARRAWEESERRDNA